MKLGLCWYGIIHLMEIKKIRGGWGHLLRWLSSGPNDVLVSLDLYAKQFSHEHSEMSFKDIIRDAEEGSWKRPRKQLYYGLVDNDVNYPSWFFSSSFFCCWLIQWYMTYHVMILMHWKRKKKNPFCSGLFWSHATCIKCNNHNDMKT